MPEPKTKVLVIDDSAVVRQAYLAVLGREPDLEVETAPDAVLGRQKIGRRRPDVVVLDVQLPKLDGLVFLEELMATTPLPVVVCSGVAGKGTERALEALRKGAVDVVNKPTVMGAGLKGVVELLDAVRAAAASRPSRPSPSGSPARATPVAMAAGATSRVVAVGTSTGGPEALRVLLAALPHGCPPVLVVQHMPEPFAAAFARDLQRGVHPGVRQARQGDAVVPGAILLAPGDRHLKLLRTADGLRVHLDSGPPVSRHRPSVDVLFESVARAAGASAIGVLMTGMGDDGAAGLLAMREAGGWTIAQSEETCVVYGMPREAVRRGAACESLPLSAIAARALGLSAKA